MKLIRQNTVKLISGGKKEHHVEVLRDIENEEYRLFSIGKNNLLQYLKHLTLFEAIKRNHIEYIQTIQNKLNDQVYGVDNNVIDAHYTLLEFNRKLINFIAISRLYLDHIETYLNRKYGKKSEQFLIFKKNTSLEFDNSFAYRLFYKLRNYVLHCGLPTGRVSGSIRVENSNNPDKIVSELILQFSRDQLLNEFSRWGSVKVDIESMPEYFDIIPLCSEYILCLERIHRDFLASERCLINDSISIIWRLYDETGKDSIKQGIATVFEKTPSGLNMDIDWLPIRALRKYFPRTIEK